MYLETLSNFAENFEVTDFFMVCLHKFDSSSPINISDFSIYQHQKKKSQIKYFFEITSKSGTRLGINELKI